MLLRQIAAITSMNLANLRARRATAAVVVVGIGGVVAVLIGLLSMAAGFSATLNDTASPDRAIVLRSGSSYEMGSWLSSEEAQIIAHLPGVAIASGELYVVLDIPKRATGKRANVIGRGVSTAAFDVRPELTIVAGRRFEPGHNELIAGVAAARAYAGLAIGDTVALRGQTWTVVGHFATGGSATDSEVWLDLPLAQALFRRGAAVSSMRLRLDPGSDAAALNAAIRTDPRLRATVFAESKFLAGQSQQQTRRIELFAYFIAAIMALGAVIAALNSMYAAVAARTVEIATLRALGFGNTPVVASVLAEALVLALAGAAVGAGLVYAAFDGYLTSTLNSASNTQVAFAFAVTPTLFAIGVGWALGLGLIGGIWPALRAARLPIATALRGD